MSRSKVMRMCSFPAQNSPFVLNKKFLAQTIIITFINLLALFIVQNLKQILTADLELWVCTILGPKMVHLPKNININFIYLLVPFIVQNSKRIITADPELWRCVIFCQMGTFSKISGSVTHNYIRALNTILSFRKK